MLRVVVDPGVLVAALISRTGASSRLLRQWLDGAFDLLVSPALLAELEDVLSRAKFRRHFTERQGAAFVGLLRERALEVADPEDVESVTRDPRDDYLVALARAAEAHVLVSGDKDLRELAEPPVPVLSARELLGRLVR